MKQVFAFISCVYIFSSCDFFTNKQFEFYYYPSKNVYYNVADNEYIFSLDGGKTWDSLNLLLNKEPATLGNKQIIYSRTPEIWLNNAEHVQQYKGHIINVTGSDSTSFRQDLAEERKLKKTVATSPVQTKEPEKKPGFFKRLFSKKNKN